MPAVLYQMCYVEDEYLSDPVQAEIQRIQWGSMNDEYYALAAVLEVATECMNEPAALTPIASKYTYPGHPHAIRFRVYAIHGHEGIFACPQYPRSFTLIHFGPELEDSVRISRLLGDLKPCWRE